MDPCMYIFVNSGLDMSPGKLAAQAGHAAVEAYRISDIDAVVQWYLGGHYKKIVLDGRNNITLFLIDRYLRDRQFRTALIIDEGRTEIGSITPTALGVEVVDKDDPHVSATFSTFELLRPRERVELPRKQPGRFRSWLQRSSKESRNDTRDPSPES